jgi:hypothetical protein
VPEADPLRKAIASLSVPAVGTPIHITDLTSGPPLEYHGVVTEELREALLTTPPECVGGIVGIDSTPEDIAELLALGRSETDGTQKLGGGKVATDRGKEDMSAESEQDPLGTEKGTSLISGQISAMSPSMGLLLSSPVFDCSSLVTMVAPGDTELGSAGEQPNKG